MEAKLLKYKTELEELLTKLDDGVDYVVSVANVGYNLYINNPSMLLFDMLLFEKLVEFCRERNITFIVTRHDEIKLTLV